MSLGRTHRPVVEPETCQRCQICLRACPAELLPELRDEDATLRGVLYRRADLAEHGDLPPCREACPLEQGVSDYVTELARGRWREAALRIRRENPLPSVCGYLCHHPCETACLRGALDAPVSIRELKRLATLYEMAYASEVRQVLRNGRSPANGHRVAVVGGGPAGLTAAHDLLMAGCAVTVFERAEGLGGALRLAIPEFRLPRAIIDHEVSMLSALGLECRVGRRISRPEDLEALRAEGFDAIILALGAQRGAPLPVEGWQGPGCEDALAFLHRFNQQDKDLPGDRVLVVGGGNVAVDAARAALRSGARETYLVYRRDREQMPADPEEVRDAEREGVKFEFRTLPAAVARRDGAVVGLVCRGTAPGPPDSTGRPGVVVGGEERTLPADVILAAVGQSPEHPFLPPDALRDDGRLVVGSDGQVPDCPGVFGAGDAVDGPGYLVQAMASGREAARRLLIHLGEDTE